MRRRSTTSIPLREPTTATAAAQPECARRPTAAFKRALPLAAREPPFSLAGEDVCDFSGLGVDDDAQDLFALCILVVENPLRPAVGSLLESGHDLRARS